MKNRKGNTSIRLSEFQIDAICKTVVKGCPIMIVESAFQMYDERGFTSIGLRMVPTKPIEDYKDVANRLSQNAKDAGLSIFGCVVRVLMDVDYPGCGILCIKYIA